ncbi:DNA-binding protein, YbaB/EbfC family [Legionella massiliensis]|uniref:DNA-binding protein, YbaB/EbfC family n=1 Tax=Legionella massiliensis TaxID=1034943 RepID=A0A078L526_9GAMM|nr:YbaB/EbfC family nucleoid-associated protein [Legionella massiliensis]CDZ79013.1 DNA-binding protein, YbaB/EbfC family [Legionella massiliensis]CEE14751.1 Nucleoid-associated protein YbaB [Legionella massiliensis]
MKTADGFIIDEEILKKLGANTLKTIRTNSNQIDVKIAEKLEDLEFLVVQGFSSEGIARARVDGNHHILELDLDPSYTDWNTSKEKTCALLTEAINDAIYKVDLAIQAEITAIKCKYSDNKDGNGSGE